MKECEFKNLSVPNKIYKEILIRLKGMIGNRSNNPHLLDDIEKSVNNEILLTMFEMYRESNERIIDALTGENNVSQNNPNFVLIISI